MLRTMRNGLLYEQPDFLLLLRIGTACLLGLSYFMLADEFELFYDLDGMLSYELLALKKESILPSIQEIQQQLRGITFNRWLTASYYALTACLLIGWATPFAAGALLLLHACIFTVLPSYSYGFDYFCQISLFYCLLFPTYRSCGVDRFLWKLKPAAHHTLYRCQKILQIHLCFVYFFNGINKAFGSTWWNGEAVWKALHLPYFNLGNTLGLTALDEHYWLITVIGLVVLFLEILYPINLFYSPARKPIIIGIIGLHLFIALFMGLYLFSMIMSLLNYCAWAAPSKQVKE